MRRLRLAVIAALSVQASGCAPAKPTVIAIMRNAASGERVEMYCENPLKVPAAYDEQQHMAEWEADQRAHGYTEELPPGS